MYTFPDNCSHLDRPYGKPPLLLSGIEAVFAGHVRRAMHFVRFCVRNTKTERRYEYYTRMRVCVYMREV